LPRVARSILIVTHFYPPSTMVAARRPAGFAKYLERLGYRVTVLTSSAWGGRPAREEPASEVVRARDLMASRINWRRRNLEAWVGDDSNADYSPGSSRLAQVIVPDVALFTWAPFALARARRIAAARRLDCVLTTSGPESVHFVGLALRRRGIPWVADLRDGWGFESIHSWPTALQRRLDERLERLAMERADAVTAVSEPIAADLRARFGVDAHTITNGYDPEAVPERTGSDELLRDDRHSLVHTGRMASSQRTPAPVLEAMRLLRRRSGADAEPASRVELVLAGPLTAEERSLVEAPDLRDDVRHVGNLPHERALRLQREADSLLLLTAGSRSGEATGKLFEYLGAERPVLVLGERSEAARIVTRTGSGTAVGADDPEAIADGIARIAGNGRREPGGDLDPTEFSLPATVARLARVLERAQRNSSA
jgi:glycosyltransferase involved in cell wall biosynthesis